jgi:predicted DNA-binding protein (UPF0278 family)
MTASKIKNGEAVDKLRTLSYLNGMEITTSIPDKLVSELRHYAQGKNLTESLINAIEEWLSMRKIRELNYKIENKPFEFSRYFSAEAVRSMNRDHRDR